MGDPCQHLLIQVGVSSLGLNSKDFEQKKRGKRCLQSVALRILEGWQEKKTMFFCSAGCGVWGGESQLGPKLCFRRFHFVSVHCFDSLVYNGYDQDDGDDDDDYYYYDDDHHHHQHDVWVFGFPNRQKKDSPRRRYSSSDYASWHFLAA